MFETGRFVEPGFIRDYGNGPLEVFGQMMEQGLFNSYLQFSNMVPKGQRPELMFSYGDTEFTEAYFKDFSISQSVFSIEATNVEANASPAPNVLTTLAGNSPHW